MMKSFFTNAVEFIQTTVYAAALFTVTTLFLFMPTEVFGSSMEPNLETGQRLIIEKLTYRFTDPQRGEIIVVNQPNTIDHMLVKRVIATSGERILLHDGAIFINGERLIENYLDSGQETRGGNYIREDMEYTIPENSFIVMGDNRTHSSDSREFGPVTKTEIQGRALYRFWPISLITTF